MRSASLWLASQRALMCCITVNLMTLVERPSNYESWLLCVCVLFCIHQMNRVMTLWSWWQHYKYRPMFTVHCLRWRIPHFMRQCWGLPDRLAQYTSPQGWGKLVNAALLSLVNEACVMYAVLPSSRVNSSAPLVCRHDRVAREAGRVGLVGRDRGGGDIEWRCTCLFILPAF